jgi:hypothetical protein
MTMSMWRCLVGIGDSLVKINRINHLTFNIEFDKHMINPLIKHESRSRNRWLEFKHPYKLTHAIRFQASSTAHSGAADHKVPEALETPVFRMAT